MTVEVTDIWNDPSPDSHSNLSSFLLLLRWEFLWNGMEMDFAIPNPNSQLREREVRSECGSWLRIRPRKTKVDSLTQIFVENECRMQNSERRSESKVPNPRIRAPYFFSLRNSLGRGEKWRWREQESLHYFPNSIVQSAMHSAKMESRKVTCSTTEERRIERRKKKKDFKLN